mmetsp:Transcript_9430/g.18037  ORF Transcript_9430/g.18037 Transcript_9430/m.18037 type:complete len:260 (+) Transcript_9430:1172-1951(+)
MAPWHDVASTAGPVVTLWRRGDVGDLFSLLSPAIASAFFESSLMDNLLFELRLTIRRLLGWRLGDDPYASEFNGAPVRLKRRGLMGLVAADSVTSRPLRRPEVVLSVSLDLPLPSGESSFPLIKLLLDLRLPLIESRRWLDCRRGVDRESTSFVLVSFKGVPVRLKRRGSAFDEDVSMDVDTEVILIRRGEGVASADASSMAKDMASPRVDSSLVINLLLELRLTCIKSRRLLDWRRGEIWPVEAVRDTPVRLKRRGVV